MKFTMESTVYTYIAELVTVMISILFHSGPIKDLDLLAIPCKEPEGFGGAYFQLNLDAVRKSSPAVGHRLHMVHAPLEMSNHEDVDTTESGLYSFGIVGKVIRGTYDTYYVYVERFNGIL